MKLALKEAEKAQKIDEVPVGCVIVQDDKVIARGHNQKERNSRQFFMLRSSQYRRPAGNLVTGI